MRFGIQPTQHWKITAGLIFQSSEDYTSSGGKGKAKVVETPSDHARLERPGREHECGGAPRAWPEPRVSSSSQTRQT